MVKHTINIYKNRLHIPVFQYAHLSCSFGLIFFSWIDQTMSLLKFNWPIFPTFNENAFDKISIGFLLLAKLGSIGKKVVLLKNNIFNLSTVIFGLSFLASKNNESGVFISSVGFPEEGASFPISNLGKPSTCSTIMLIFRLVLSCIDANAIYCVDISHKVTLSFVETLVTISMLSASISRELTIL